jgi:hypothetical protein
MTNFYKSQHKGNRKQILKESREFDALPEVEKRKIHRFAAWKFDELLDKAKKKDVSN